MGFLRFRELSNLKRSDFILHNTHMSIFIEKNKTGIYRKEHWKLFFFSMFLIIHPPKNEIIQKQQHWNKGWNCHKSIKAETLQR